MTLRDLTADGLYCLLALTPVVRCATIVIDKAVIGAVFDRRSCCSVNQPLLLVTTAVAVAGPPPPPPAFTVSAIVVVRTVDPDVPVIVTFAVPSVAAPDAVSVCCLR